MDNTTSIRVVCMFCIPDYKHALSRLFLHDVVRDVLSLNNQSWPPSTHTHTHTHTRYNPPTIMLPGNVHQNAIRYTIYSSTYTYTLVIKT